MVTMPHFRVLTTASESTARKWAVELERFRVMLHEVVNVPEAMVRPVTVVLFRSERAMRPYQPLEKGQPQELAGLFVNVGDSHAIELSLDGDPAVIRRIIFHEAVHWYSNAAEVPLPMWLEEGVAEVYSTFRVENDGTCTFGDTIPEHLRLLQRHHRWSMPRLVNQQRDSLEYNEGERASQFYAEAWLAAHYLLFGRGTPGRASVARYLQNRATASDPERAFQQSFGVDYAGFGQKLTSYLSDGRYSLHRYRPPPDAVTKLPQVRSATEADVELALATLLLGARQKRTPESEAHLQRAVALAPGNPLIWQLRGEGALLDKQPEEAGRYFARAVECGSTSYFVHYGLAVSLGEDLGRQGFLADSGVARRSLSELRRTLQLNPRFVPAYEGLAGLIYAVEESSPADRDLLAQGRRLAPENLTIRAGFAACELKAGNREAGRQGLESVLAESKGVTPELRKLIQGILRADSWLTLTRELEVLFAAARFHEAVAKIQAHWEEYPDPEFRPQLAVNLRRAQGYAAINDAVALANAGELAPAKARLEEVQATSPDEGIRREAQRLLRELDNRSPRTRR